ncbi:MAG: iron-containing alcohol dehydrogenase, partial [bacterium]|nr:iron-containing alcohol dehydrogenase [bacterium]
DLALVDPELTVSMPHRITASSGLDALCQAMEGFWSTIANPVTRSLSLQGIVLVMRNLESACKNKDRDSVSNMALASHLTGIQMSSIGNTAIHPLSYPFTMDYGMLHGFACAIFLPAFIRFNASHINELCGDLLKMLELPNVEAFADAVDALMDHVDAPKRLSEVGVKTEDIPALVKRGIGGSTPRNPRPVSEEDIIQICQSIL